MQSEEKQSALCECTVAHKYGMPLKLFKIAAHVHDFRWTRTSRNINVVHATSIWGHFAIHFQSQPYKYVWYEYKTSSVPIILWRN